MLGMTVPVHYELAVELTYPLPESVSCGLLTLFMNAGTMVFSFVPPAANAYMNVIMTGTVLLAVLMAAAVTEQYLRSTSDSKLA